MATSGRVSHAEAEGQAKGLRNLGNTCYFNAVMQCLLRTDLLLEEIKLLHQQLHHQHQQQQQQQESFWLPLTEALLRFAKDGKQTEAELKQLLDAFQGQSTKFSVGRQHDSHDFLIHFLNDLRDEEKRFAASASALVPIRNYLTVVDKVLGGHLVTDYTCLRCGDLHRSCEPLLTISLPVVRSKKERHLEDICISDKLRRQIEATSRPLTVSNKTTPRKFHRIKTSVNRSFRHFTRFEEIRDEYLCHKCQRPGGSVEPHLTTAIKRTLIYNPPAVLVLHMKRFEQVAGRFRKRDDKIRYKELLDLGPYCMASCKRVSQQDQSVWYSLFGVIVHSGSLKRGHYVAYVKEGRASVQYTKAFLQASYVDRDTEPSKEIVEQRRPTKDQEPPNPPSGRWFYISDNYVRRLANSKEALNKEAYLLFYERIGPPLKTDEKTTSVISHAF